MAGTSATAAAGPGGGNIKVVVRVRPFNGREIDRGARCIVQMEGSQTVLLPPPEAEERLRGGKAGGKDNGQKVFAFDHSYWSFNRDDPHFAGQDDLHKDLGKPLLDNAFQGYNNCIFAYGQTGSGKSYSMMGYGKEAGVIPKICQDMFERIGDLQQDQHLKCTVEVSYLEIYNERVRDLLNPATKGNLKVREHPSTGPYVEDLAKLAVSSFNEIEHLMDEGNKARTVAATNMNETSSRSHAVFTLTLTQKRHDVETNMAMEKVAKISLVDLAGSERATSTGATGARLKEGAEINRSLSTLGRVIAALADLSDNKKKKAGKGSQVPYRDSVLTWLLKDSLGGNSMTAMIAAISPADINFEETLSTLRYADSAKRIKNHAVVNEDANARMIRELKEELTALRSKLSGGGGASEETYAPGTPLDQQIVSIVQADGTVKKVSKAEIAEQLNQSEKLYSDLNQTWEQKLQKTEEIHKEREAALEELGISIEKGFVGLSTPKKMPHLVNLSDDPLLAECLVYNLKPGTTTVGNAETNAAHTTEIRLHGTRILHEHCVFENLDNVVTLLPKAGAAVMVNGRRVLEPTRLRSGYRVILGDFHIFRFNNPTEARAERAEQSLLRHSLTAAQLQESDRAASSPSPRPGHDRSYSKAISEMEFEGNSRSASPIPYPRGRDSDWSFARREAAGAILGSDQKIAGLTDEELNLLFEDVQKARAERAARDPEDDMDSVTSYPTRDKYLSNGTLDNFSLDTALTMPSTPKQGPVDEKMREVREEMQSQLDKQKEEFQKQLQTAEAANVEVEEIKKEKTRMEESLREVKEDMLKQLETQRREFEEKLRLLTPAKDTSTTEGLSETEESLARNTISHWKQRRYVRMAQDIISSASMLKEAQVMSHNMDEHVSFQLTVVDVGHDMCSSYDMVLNGISDESDDLALEEAAKPCIAVRVVDYKHTVVHLWSLAKFRARVRTMKQMHHYIDRPEYLQHFRLDNPFTETCMPQYTHVGDAEVPLTTVFQSRVQDFNLEVLSPYTSHAIGMVKLSLEPSSARAPSSTLKFNVVMHDLVGFAEREGTEVHAQLFLPGASLDNGVTTTQMIKDFDEGPIRFESVHSMSVPMFGPTDVCLRIAIYAKVSSMHLDKLLSWDNMRDEPQQLAQKTKSARIAESQFNIEEKHDVFARVQILELAESGEYNSVEVIQTHDLDCGAYQLHQGLQRRIVLHLTHSSGEALPWQSVTNLRVGRIQLLDQAGRLLEVGVATPDIPLKMLGTPTIRDNVNGTSNVVLTGQWDSSAHGSLLLDRTTADKYKIQVTLLWDVTSPKLTELMTFATKLVAQVMSRSHVRSKNFFSSLFQTVRIIHSTSTVFQVLVSPTPVKRSGELWRLNNTEEYIKGEENLTDWSPRGVSLIKDFIAARMKKQRQRDLEAVRPVLARFGSLPVPPNDIHESANDSEDGVLNGQQKALLEKYTSAFCSVVKSAPLSAILQNIVASPPSLPPVLHDDVSTSRRTASPPNTIPKSPHLMKSGYLLLPSADSTRWIRRFAECRMPYLFIHDVASGEEVGIIGLEGGRVEGGRIAARLLKGLATQQHPSESSDISSRTWSKAPMARAGLERKVFAIYARTNTWLLAAPSEKERGEWVWTMHEAGLGMGADEEEGLHEDLHDDIDWGGR